MRLILTVIITVILIILVLNLHPASREFFAKFFPNQKSNTSNVNVMTNKIVFSLNASYEDLIIIGNSNLTISSGNILLKTSVGDIETNRSVDILGFVGEAQVHKKDLDLSGSFKEIRFGETKITSNGNIDSGTPFSNLVISGNGFLNLTGNGTIFSEKKSLSASFSGENVIIEGFAGMIKLGENMEISGSASDVKIVKEVIL